jgi:hypothetical protein
MNIVSEQLISISSIAVKLLLKYFLRTTGIVDLLIFVPSSHTVNLLLRVTYFVLYFL